MSDTERVRAWRQRLKDNGLVPMTIWVKAEIKARYEDLALQSHHSASELAQLALDAYRLDSALVAVPVTDPEQIRAIVREELDEAMAIITATITAIVTDTARETLPALVEAALQRYETDTVPDTETATPQEPSWLSTVGLCIRYSDGCRNRYSGERAVPGASSALCICYGYRYRNRDSAAPSYCSLWKSPRSRYGDSYGHGSRGGSCRTGQGGT